MLRIERNKIILDGSSYITNYKDAIKEIPNSKIGGNSKLIQIDGHKSIAKVKGPNDKGGLTEWDYIMLVASLDYQYKSGKFLKNYPIDSNVTFAELQEKGVFPADTGQALMDDAINTRKKLDSLFWGKRPSSPEGLKMIHILDAWCHSPIEIEYHDTYDQCSTDYTLNPDDFHDEVFRHFLINKEALFRVTGAKADLNLLKLFKELDTQEIAKQVKKGKENVDRFNPNALLDFRYAEAHDIWHLDAFRRDETKTTPSKITGKTNNTPHIIDNKENPVEENIHSTTSKAKVNVTNSNNTPNITNGIQASTNNTPNNQNVSAGKVSGVNTNHPVLKHKNRKIRTHKWENEYEEAMRMVESNLSKQSKNSIHDSYYDVSEKDNNTSLSNKDKQEYRNGR